MDSQSEWYLLLSECSERKGIWVYRICVVSVDESEEKSVASTHPSTTSTNSFRAATRLRVSRTVMWRVTVGVDGGSSFLNRCSVVITGPIA